MWIRTLPWQPLLMTLNGSITMDTFRENAVFRMAIRDLPPKQAYTTIAKMILRASRLPGYNKAVLRSDFLEALILDTHNIHLAYLRTHETMKRKFQQQWTFAKVDLSPEDRQAFIEYEQQPSNDPLDLMVLLLQQGYKVSLTQNASGESYIATLTGTEFSAHNNKVSLSAFHETPEKAVLLVCYKHFVLCDGTAWDLMPQTPQWG